MTIDIDTLKKRIDNITATNKNPLYNSHIYWSQKPYNVCDVLINALSQEGDIIFDPFMGSGVTIFESIKNSASRIGIGCEINDAPIFIVNTLLQKYDLEKYKKISLEFLNKVRKLEKYYYTTCPKCSSNGVIYSVIFDKDSRESAINIKTINYRCKCSKRMTKIADKKDYEYINVSYNIKKINDTLLVPNSKIAVYQNQKIEQIFTKRNFAVLDQILKIIDDLEDYNNIFKYILMSILHLSKITDKHSNSQWPLWIPKVDCVEKNIIDLLEKKINKFTETIEYLNKNYNEHSDYKIIHKGSQHITTSDIEDESVQLIVTDPPYLGQVVYSEYMQLYKPFLNLNFNLLDEIIVSSAPSREKNEEKYFTDLNSVFSICSKKIKTNGYMCLYFHDSNLDVWDKLIKILSNNHFRYLTQVHIRKSNTLKNIINPKKSLNGDCILFFIKDFAADYSQSGTESSEEIEKNIVKQAKFLIRQHSSLSTPELYDKGLMEILIQNGWLSVIAKKYKSLVEIFEKYLKWDSELLKWTL